MTNKSELAFVEETLIWLMKIGKEEEAIMKDLENSNLEDYAEEQQN